MSENKGFIRSLNLPNRLTLLRVVLVPVYLVLAKAGCTRSVAQGGALRWLALLVFALASLTDLFDGKIARKYNLVTNFGKFLDPIADKLCVTCAMLYLLELELVPSWAVLVILAREFIVSGLRMVVASEGTVIAASNLGKWKTAVTMLAIGGFLLSVTIPAGKLATMLELLSHALMTAAVVLTAWSGIDYLVKSWPAVAHSK